VRISTNDQRRDARKEELLTIQEIHNGKSNLTIQEIHKGKSNLTTECHNLLKKCSELADYPYILGLLDQHLREHGFTNRRALDHTITCSKNDGACCTNFNRLISSKNRAAAGSCFHRLRSRSQRDLSAGKRTI
jgi:hypothetical protein